MSDELSLHLENDIQLELIRVGERTLDSGTLTRSRNIPETIIVQCLQGRYEIRTESQTVFVDPGEVGLICSDTPFTNLHHRDVSGVMSSRWIHCRFTVFGNIDFSSLLDMPLKVSGPSAAALGVLIGQLLLLAKDRPSLLSGIKTNELAFKVLHEIYGVSQPKLADLEKIKHPGRLSAVFDFVDEKLGAPITVKDLAHIASMSLSRFFPFFKEHMRMSPMDYVKKRRITMACRHLVTTDMPIAEIAVRVGFRTQFHFSRVFKELCGETPSAYRSQLGNAKIIEDILSG